MLDFLQIDNSWTLFLDRDGVINHEKKDDYVHTWDEFIFYDGVKEAFSIFEKKFNKIIIVTNQRGIAKGITTIENVVQIHEKMKAEIEQAGGRIDAIYFCPDMESENRKPNAGMGLQAIEKFPTIDVEKSIMVGNSISDMQFGRNLGTKTVYLTTTKPNIDLNQNSIDAVFKDLISFAKQL